jgi:hypothetical protein
MPLQKFEGVHLCSSQVCSSGKHSIAVQLAAYGVSCYGCKPILHPSQQWPRLQEALKLTHSYEQDLQYCLAYDLK